MIGRFAAGLLASLIIGTMIAVDFWDDWMENHRGWLFTVLGLSAIIICLIVYLLATR